MTSALALGLGLVAFAVAPGAWGHPGIDEQIAYLTERIAEDPDNAELYVRRAELHRIHRDWPAAESDYKQARQLDPELAEIDLGYGTMLLDAGKPKPALTALDRFLTARPDNVAGLVASARARAELGDDLGAARDYTRALEHSPGDRRRPGIYLERARALTRAGDEWVDEAVRGLDVGIAELGQPVTLQLLAIDLDVKRKRYDAALARVEQIASRSQRQETWLVRRAEILESAGRRVPARQAYGDALAAIEALPAGRRQNRAVQRLLDAARDGLARLAEGQD